MKTSRPHARLSDTALTQQLSAAVARTCTELAVLLGYLAEFDARKLYLPAAHPSLFAYCVEVLGMSEDVALKRIRVARAAREFPAIFEAVAAGRLNLSAVILLTAYLTPENAEELLASAAGKPRVQLQRLIACRFPRPDLPTRLAPLAPGPPPASPAFGGRVEEVAVRPPDGTFKLEGGAEQVAPGPPRGHLTPHSPGRSALQVMLRQETHAMILEVRDLLAPQLPSGDLAELVHQAFEALLEKALKQKCAATSRPRASRRPVRNKRTIPAHVKRAVWARDQGQCTFRSESGKRCPSRRAIEFDHLDPVARGGQATVAGIRLRCRAHNQYAAEQTFGVTFMQEKREAAQAAAAQRKAEREAVASHEAERVAVAARRAELAAEAARQSEELAIQKARAAEVIPWLRQLGFRVDEARRGATACESIADAPLEERVRVAIASLARAPRSMSRREQPNASASGRSPEVARFAREGHGAWPAPG